MNRLKAWIRAFFGFSRTETNAFVILLPLMAIIIFAEPAYQYWFTHQPPDFKSEKNKLDSLIARMKWETADSISHIEKTEMLFAFNPNRISADSLTLLGLSPVIAKRIANYRAKGGKFYSIKDLKKMYGIDSAWIAKVKNYVAIPSLSEKKKEIKTDSKPASKTLIDLNLADTTQLKSIYGIGSKLSARIINYRSKLGGFVSMNQFKEVYGLDTSVVKAVERKFFVVENFQPVQLNVNTADENQLASHPYIKSKLASTIVAYRRQHGDFKQLEDLKGISILSLETFEKIKPYLSTNP